MGFHAANVPVLLSCCPVLVLWFVSDLVHPHHPVLTQGTPGHTQCPSSPAMASTKPSLVIVLDTPSPAPVRAHRSSLHSSGPGSGRRLNQFGSPC
ncbi:uncharacterized protein BJ171DRAFT_8621 [Polychytrium aggregatum]|uniref:uncharacterized protein n=1 Tax=Polychytrium aggregatum TaxID=110093 RepID=UPI0022FE48E6|nr:uncharacterized protein BJ171DRAFT_8621 [Polychytrium aggregatum]KAI9209846.1 hypothetical protein BJ171DRAFT_8621 [Polychytrium aggregatum]